MKRKVLVVEDQPDLARLVALHVADLGCEVDLAFDGESALRQAQAVGYDLVVLDVMLPEIDGLEVCRRLRSGSAYVPILMLTSRDSEADRVLGLETGADDYLTKPFSMMELIARVKAVFRRSDALAGTPAAPPDRLSVGELVIEPGKRRVTVAGLEIDLTGKEFDLLLFFAQNPGRVYSRAQLLDAVWGYGEGGYEHTVNSHINRLRSKVERDPAEPRYILTVWGVGYKFTDSEAVH